MKKIGLSQRVDDIESYKERRDSLDQRWAKLLLDVDMLPIPLPNLKAEQVDTLFLKLNLDGVILTGGNNLSHLEANDASNAPERDAFESALIQKAMARNLPILGVCRGMQLLNYFFGGTCSKIQNHVSTSHPIRNLTDILEFPSEVNSFHNWGISEDEMASDLIPLAVDSDGYIEAMQHQGANIYGIMWHPERDKIFKSENTKLLQEIFS